MVIALLLSPARTVFPIVPREFYAQKMRHFLYTFGAKTVPEHPEKQHTGMIYHDGGSLLTSIGGTPSRAFLKRQSI